MSTRTATTATVYLDTQDSDNAGWAYSIRYNDDHEESGSLDDVDSDDDVLSAFEALIAGWGGGVEWADGSVEHSDHDGGSYTWTAHA